MASLGQLVGSSDGKPVESGGDGSSRPVPLKSPFGAVPPTSFSNIRLAYGARKTKPAMADGGVFTGIVWGPKDGGKSRFTLGYPKPHGTRTIILTYDHTTIMSLRSSFGPNWMEKHQATVYKPTMADVKSGYRGYNKSDVTTAVECWAETMAILEEEKAKNDVGIVLADHFQLFYSGICSDMIYAVRRLDPLTGRPEFSDWNIRTKSAQAVEELIRTTPVDGGAAFITGYGMQEGFVQEKDGAGKTQIRWETKWPTWLGNNGEVSRDWLVAIELSRELVQADGHTRPIYWATVVGSKIKDRLPLGLKLDWTNGDIGSFLKDAAARRAAEDLVLEETTPP